MTEKRSGTFTIIIKQQGNEYTIEADGPNDIRVMPQRLRSLEKWLSSKHRETIEWFKAEKVQNQPNEFSQRLVQLGKRLIEVLFHRSGLGMSFGQAVGLYHDSGIRLCLQVEPPELAALPWETMYDVNMSGGLPLNIPLLRCLPPANSGPIPNKLKIEGPLRILFVAASPDGLPKLSIAKLAKALQEQLRDAIEERQIMLDIVLNATLEALRDKLLPDEHHILFFAGHGKENKLCFDDGQGDDGQAGDPCWLTAQDMARELAGKTSLRLLFLAACHVPSDKTATEQKSLAHQLWDASTLPAIVAMQSFISDKQANTLSLAFFKAIAEGQAVDIALNHARKALIYRDSQVGRDVFAPVLFWRAAEERLFERLMLQNKLVTRPAAPGESPYKGLRYFEEEDADQFFGREKLTAELVDLLLKQRFLAVVGASGSGKSSLLRAGIVPAFKRGQAKDGASPPLIPPNNNNRGGTQNDEYWLVRIITPTNHPLETLATSLTEDIESVTAIDTLKENLAQNPRSLHLYARKLLSRTGRSKRLLLVVDQFEELFTLCRDKKEQEAFVNNLLTATSAATNGPTLAVIALRADFYAHCSEFDDLREALEQQQKYIGPMNKVELRQSIEKPAEKDNWRFQSGLVELLLKEVGHEPGALPLLSHALHETWQRRSARTLTFAGYHDSGGVKGAIAQSADHLYQQLTTEEQAVVRAIFLQLTELGHNTPDTRRRVPLAELSERAHSADKPLVERVINILADARLLTVFKASIEVAHEALIREWPRLREWLGKDREGLRIQRRLSEAAQAWEDLNHDAGALYRGLMLSQALEWVKSHHEKLNEREKLFLLKSKEWVELQRAEREARLRREIDLAQAREQDQIQAASRLRTRNRIITVIGITALITALLATFFALQANISAQENANLAATSEIRSQENADLAATNEAIAEEKAELAATSETVAEEKVIIASTAQAASTRVAVQRDEAELQARIAMISQLVAQSDAALDEYPQRSLLFALESFDLAKQTENVHSFVANQMIRNGLIQTTGIGLSAHEGDINDVTISPDGQWLVTASDDQTARLWNLKELTTTPIILRGHQGSINSVTISPDGQWLVTASDDQTARVWDLKEPIAAPLILRGHSDSIRSVAFSPDGQSLVTASDDQTARVWDLKDPTAAPLILRGHEHTIYTVAISPDGQWLVTASRDKTARLWKMSELEAKPIILRGHKDTIRDVAISSNARWLVTASDDKTARVWDLAEPTVAPLILRGHEDKIRNVTISPDEQWVVTGSWDNTARVWDLTQPTAAPFILRGHEGSIYSIAISPDGQFLVTTSDDRTTRVWDLAQPTVAPLILRGHEDIIRDVVISPDGQRFVTASDDQTARVWNLDELQSYPLILRGHEDTIRDVVISPDGQRLVTASDDQTARVWNLAEPTTAPLILRGHDGPIYTVATSSDGQWLVTGSTDNTARLWNLKESDPTTSSRILRGHEGPIYTAAISTQGQWLVTGSWDNTARLWNLKEPTDRSLTLPGHKGHIYTTVISPDEQWLVTGSDDQTVGLWNMKEPTVAPLMLRGHEGAIWDVAISPDGRWLVTGSADRTAHLWNLETPESTPFTLRGHEDDIYTVAISPDARWLVTASADRTARLWNLESRSAQPLILRSHDDAIIDMVFSPDGQWLVTASWDSTARVWDLGQPEAEPLILHGHEDAINGVAISPDGQWLVTASDDRTARLWTLSDAHLIELACRAAGRNFTQTEWEQYFGGQPYRKTCEALPVHYTVEAGQ